MSIDWWLSELGVRSLQRSSRDSYILMAECFCRMAAYGITTLVLALFFQELGISETQIGLFMTLTLIGDVILSYIITFNADKLGRRRVLFYAAIAMALSGLVFVFSSNYYYLLLAAVIGVISPSGDETGPFKSIEESTLAHLTPYEDRSDVFAWFQMLGTLGSAVGSLGGGVIIAYLQESRRLTVLESYRAVFVIYSGLACVKVVLNLFLSKQCEADSTAKDGAHEPLLRSQPQHSDGDGDEGAQPLSSFSRETFRVMIKLCTLFAIDSLGAGFVPKSWVVVFFNRKFGIGEEELGTLLFATTLVGSVTALLSSSVYKRIGPVPAMVATHLPAAVFNVATALPSNKRVAMLMLLGRAATTTMDVVPRQVFLSSVVQPHERTRVMGVVNVVKTMARSIGPTLTGRFAEVGCLSLMFYIGGALETGHDVGLLLLFGHVYQGPGTSNSS